MIFNFWRRYPKRKPKEGGTYTCKQRSLEGVIHINELYYDADHDKWIDMARQSVFDGYQVYKVCRVPNEDTRVWTDGLCVRDDVVAWKELPRAYKRKWENVIWLKRLF